MAKSKEKVWVKTFIITTFVSLYAVVSLISTIHVIDFFKLSNDEWLAISLAIGFEIGAAASLASIIALEKMNKSIVWILFFLLTAMQAMGNTYYAYSHLKDFTQWSELFGLIEEDVIYQKRILSIISGAILPLVALGFIKSLVDYIRPSDEDEQKTVSIEDQPKVEPQLSEPEKVEIVEVAPNHPEEIQPIIEVVGQTPKIQEEVVQEESSSIDELVTPEISQKKEEPIEIDKIKEKTPKIIQTGYRADFSEESIDLGSSEVIEDDTQTNADNKNSNWHRVFNNELTPENLK